MQEVIMAISLDCSHKVFKKLDLSTFPAILPRVCPPFYPAKTTKLLRKNIQFSE